MSPPERLVSPAFERGDDPGPLRPIRMDDFIGQPHLRERVTIAIESAQRRGEPLDHLILSGPPGLGKTTLAGIIAEAMGTKLTVTSGPAMKQPIDLVGLLLNMEEGGVLFIDEIHAMSRRIEEYLYPAMEDGQVDLVTARQAKGFRAQALRVPIPRFTLIGATTRKGKLSAPLRDRFGINLTFDFYPDAELQRIVTRSAGILGMDISPNATLTIAQAARGTPRIANRLLRRIRDYALVRGHGTMIDSTTCVQAMALEGVDRYGLDELDRRYLETLVHQYDGGPTGLHALAATMNLEPEELEQVVEPYLLHANFINRSGSGRVATNRSFRVLAEILAA